MPGYVLAYIPWKYESVWGSALTSLNLHMIDTHGWAPVTASGAAGPKPSSKWRSVTTTAAVVRPALAVVHNPVTVTRRRFRERRPPTRPSIESSSLSSTSWPAASMRMASGPIDTGRSGLPSPHTSVTTPVIVVARPAVVAGSV